MPSSSQAAGAQDSIAIVGATLIDGNGGPPVRDSLVLVEGDRIVAVGRGNFVEIPREARRIDASGKFMTPGFIDTNVCLSGVFIEQGPNGFAYEGTPLETTNYSNYDLTLEGAQMQLKFGVTTVARKSDHSASVTIWRPAMSRPKNNSATSTRCSDGRTQA